MGCVRRCWRIVPSQRVTPSQVASSSPGAAFQLRITVLAVQTDSADEFLADLAALVTVADRVEASGSRSPRALHDAWWSSFWARSYVDINVTDAGAAREAYLFREAHAVGSMVASLPVSGASLWLRASSLAGTANGSFVGSWKDESSSGTSLSQVWAVERGGVEMLVCC